MTKAKHKDEEADTNETAPTNKTVKEKDPLVQIAESCIAVFDFVGRTVPSNFKPQIDAEVDKLKKLVK